MCIHCRQGVMSFRWYCTQCGQRKDSRADWCCIMNDFDPMKTLSVRLIGIYLEAWRA